MMQFIPDGQWSFPNLVANNGESQRIGEVPLQCRDGRVHPTRSKYHGIEQFAADPVPNGGLVLAGKWSDLPPIDSLRFKLLSDCFFGVKPF
jgi:hypothetical protein